MHSTGTLPHNDAPSLLAGTFRAAFRVTHYEYSIEVLPLESARPQPSPGDAGAFHGKLVGVVRKTRGSDESRSYCEPNTSDG
jgi:hypothetical protein